MPQPAPLRKTNSLTSERYSGCADGPAGGAAPADQRWREEARRTGRFYRLSRTGVAMLAQPLAEWNAIPDSILRITEEDM